MDPTSPSPPTYEQRICRVRLWPLYPLLMVPLVSWLYVRDALGVSSATHEVVFQLLLVGIPIAWWLLKAAPRPLSVRATMGRLPGPAEWRSIAWATLGLSCVRMIWWLSPHFSALVEGAPHGISFSFSTPASGAPFATLATVVLVPITEELVFRGTFFRKWRARWGPVTALLLSSAAFAALHFDGRVVASFLCGLTFVSLYTRTRSLWAPFIVHALNNAVPELPRLWGETALIRLQRPWEYGAFALLLVFGVGVWLHFVIKSWKTLGDPLPPDELQAALPPLPLVLPEPGRAGV
jgi:membrane protease YdiL (CAAX protease family)